MIINPYAFGVADPFTNGAGQQAILIAPADSTGGYASDSIAGPTPAAGTVYEWNGSSIVEVGSTDLINSGFAGSNKGSPWTTFGVNRYNATGKKTVYCDSHVFDSSILLTSDSASAWTFNPGTYSKGTAYTNMKTKADATLAAVGVTKFKAIFFQLGVNDIGDNLFTAAQLTAAYNKLIEYLQADFPGSPIYLIVPSVVSHSTTTQSQLQSDVMWHINRTAPTLYTDVKTCHYAQVANALGLQSGAHWNSVYNAYMGAAISRYLIDVDTETDDDVRLVTNLWPAVLSASHKAAWKTAILDLKTEGFWQVCNYFKMDISTDQANEVVNVTGVCQPFSVEGTTYQWFANDCIQTGNNGVNSWRSMGFVPSLHTKYGDANDQIVHNYIQINNTPGTTACMVFGSGISGWYLTGTTGNFIHYKASDGTNSIAGGAPIFPSGNWFGVSRNDSATKNQVKNSTNNDTESIGGAVLNTGRISKGGGQGGSLMNAKHEGFFVAKLSGYSLANVLTILNTLRTALRTP